MNDTNDVENVEDLIETLWNVKEGRKTRSRMKGEGFNRDIVECKVLTE